MKTQLLIIFSILIFCFPKELNAQCLEQDSLALVDLYNSTGGPAWFNNTNWLTGPVYSWFGVIHMNADSSRVLDLTLVGNNLEGFLPNSITNLTECKTLIIGVNLLSGTLPDSLQNMTELRELNLSTNNFFGQIPESIGQMQSVLSIDLTANNFSGAFPESILNLIQHPPLISIRLNKFSSIPIFSNNWFMPGIHFDVLWNKLSFENFEYGPPSGLVYLYQDSMYDPIDTTVLAGSDLWIHSKVGGSANQYFWVKNQVGIPGETDTSLLLENITFADSGYYSCVINNPLVPLLTLWRHSVHVRVVDTVSTVQDVGLASRTSFRYNPGDHAVSLSVNTDKPYELAVSLLDLSGKEACRLFQGTTTTTRHSFLLPSLPPGLYLVRIMLDQEQLTKKIILTGGE